jgi:hypothetical protein
MSEALVLRCSGLPLAFLCAGSVRRAEGELLIDETNDAADTGTAAHEGLAVLVERGSVDWDALPELARRHNVEEPELRMLLAQGARLWAEVRGSFPDPLTEVELEYEDEHVRMTGHADIIGRSADTVHVGDWKTGRKDNDYREQLLGYAALALYNGTTLESATAGVLWVRETEYEHYTLDRKALPAWRERLQTDVVEWDGTFRPGSHCEHCPRNHACPAAAALVRRDVLAIADKATVARVEDADALAAMAPEELVELLDKADRVGKNADRVRAAIRALVIRSGDVVGGGKRLTLQHEERRHLNVLAAFPVLQERGFEDAEMAEVIDISAAKAEKVVAAKAGKGNGARAVRELRAALEEASAIEVGVITKLVVRRAT